MSSRISTAESRLMLGLPPGALVCSVIVLPLFLLTEVRENENARRSEPFIGDDESEASAARVVTPFRLAEGVVRLFARDAKSEIDWIIRVAAGRWIKCLGRQRRDDEFSASDRSTDCKFREVIP